MTGRETTEKCVDTKLELYVSRKEENKVGKKKPSARWRGGLFFGERASFFFRFALST